MKTTIVNTLYGMNVSDLVLVTRSKSKGFHSVVLRTSDRKFEISFEEEYSGAGVECKAKLYWYGLIPFYLSPVQKEELIAVCQDFLVEKVYGTQPL